MAEIMGTVTSIKRYLSPEKIELKISPDMGPENTIILPQNRRYIIPDFQREIRWEENNLSILLSDLSSSPRFLGNIILTIERNGNCQIIDGQQRTTILLLIIAYIKSRYQEQLEPFTPCLIENRSFIGLSELMNNGFDNSLLEKPEIIKTDYYSQRQSFIDLWRWLEKEESFATAHTAKTILENIEKSRVNIIASHEDESNSSIRYFLDVNLKGVQLDIEDIFKAQIFSLSLSDEMLQLWRENKTAMLIFNQTKIKGEPEKKSKERYPLMKVYEHFFYCDLFKSKPALEQEKLKFGEDFYHQNTFEFSIKDAQREHYLVEYQYRILPCAMPEDDWELYKTFSREIVQLQHTLEQEDNEKEQLRLRQRIEGRYRDRAKLLKKNDQKAQALQTIFDEIPPTARVLIYGDDLHHLAEIGQALDHMGKYYFKYALHQVHRNQKFICIYFQFFARFFIKDRVL